MIQINEKAPNKDNIEERNDAIEAILGCKVGDVFKVDTYNLNSWKSTFYQSLRKHEVGVPEGLKKKYSLKTLPNDLKEDFVTLKIWRVR